MNINATQSHSGEHVVTKRLYAILEYVLRIKMIEPLLGSTLTNFYNIYTLHDEAL